MSSLLLRAAAAAAARRGLGQPPTAPVHGHGRRAMASSFSSSSARTKTMEGAWVIPLALCCVVGVGVVANRALEARMRHNASKAHKEDIVAAASNREEAARIWEEAARLSEENAKKQEEIASKWKEVAFKWKDVANKGKEEIIKAQEETRRIREETMKNHGLGNQRSLIGWLVGPSSSCNARHHKT